MGIGNPPEPADCGAFYKKVFPSQSPLGKVDYGLSFFFILLYFDELLAKTGTGA
jgi:hypothetical protein